MTGRGPKLASATFGNERAGLCECGLAREGDGSVGWWTPSGDGWRSDRHLQLEPGRVLPQIGQVTPQQQPTLASNLA
jgi:hypothetical protein